MKLRDIASELKLENLTSDLDQKLDVDVTAGYASDLLSDILANAPAGGIAVTIQVHMNTVAVAVHARLAAVILAASRRPEPDVIDRATEEGIVLFVAETGTFDLVGRLYAMGLREANA